MKRIRALATGLFFISGVAVGQFEGVAEYKGTTQAGSGKTAATSWKLFIGKAGWRSEMQMDMKPMATGMPKAQAAMIPDTWKMTSLGKKAERGVSYAVNDEKKVYAVIRDVGEETKTPSEKWAAEKRGKDTVAGFSCENVLMKTESGSEMDGCFTKDIVGSTDWLTAMRRERRGGEWVQALRKAGVEGFPVRMAFRAKGQTQPGTTFELVKAERKSLPEALFQVPAGYKEVGLMAVWTTPEQDKAMAEQMKKMQEMLDKMPPEQRKQYEEMMKAYSGEKKN